MLRRIRVALLVALMSLAAAPAAFAQGYGNDPASGSTATTMGTAMQSAAAGATQVRLWKTALGMVLSDAQGRTLYALEKDKNATSTCYDQCAAAWPPLTSDTATAGPGLDQAMLGTTKRKDGKSQVTFNNWPLYYYGEDTKPGDVKGQGQGGVWYVLDANGKMVKGKAGGGLPYTGPSEKLLPIAGVLLAMGLAVLIGFRGRGRHARRRTSYTW